MWSPPIIFPHVHILHSPSLHPHAHCTYFAVLSFIINSKVNVRGVCRGILTESIGQFNPFLPTPLPIIQQLPIQILYPLTAQMKCSSILLTILFFFVLVLWLTQLKFREKGSFCGGEIHVLCSSYYANMKWCEMSICIHPQHLEMSASWMKQGKSSLLFFCQHFLISALFLWPVEERI
jgi:hypothetical protein